MQINSAENRDLHEVSWRKVTVIIISLTLNIYQTSVN